MSSELNLRLEDEGESEKMVKSEVLKFEAVNGFLNVFLQNDQFMDRVQLMMKKKHLTYKEGEFNQNIQNETQEPAFVVRNNFK